MEIKCLKCENKLDVRFADMDTLPTVHCEQCGSLFNFTVKVELTEVDMQQAPETENVQEAQTEADKEGVFSRNNKVLICMSGIATKEILGEILTAEGFEPDFAKDTDELLKMQKEIDPSIVIIDVDTMIKDNGNVIELITQDDPSAVKVLLVASIYRQNRYKREPDDLFGADGYIERHQIKSILMDKLREMVEGKKSGVSKILELTSPSAGMQDDLPGLTVQPCDDKAADEQEEPKGDSSDGVEASEWVAPGAASQEDPEVAAAKRLARIIVSDIALYNQKAIENGIKDGTFFELLKDDIEEGKRLYGSRVSKSVQDQGNYYKDALLDFIKKKKAQLTRSA